MITREQKPISGRKLIKMRLLIRAERGLNEEEGKNGEALYGDF